VTVMKTAFSRNQTTCVRNAKIQNRACGIIFYWKDHINSSLYFGTLCSLFHVHFQTLFTQRVT